MQESVGQELISFRIGEQEFCVDIMAVREIRGWTQATPLPQAPSYVRGVINLRGAVLPIVDLAARLGLGEQVEDGLGARNRIVLVAVIKNAPRPLHQLGERHGVESAEVFKRIADL